ncbi:MAG: Nif3-like dinuclear metal center hexameric protein [Desulfatibacillum sp.]|nr:Nif3-like dinuclear metal center hexameric protein [Desulfatibacillum sp.]
MAQTRVRDIVNIVEKAAPPALAETWDNTGLALGRMDSPVRKIWVALDPLPLVVEEACKNNVDLLITHHPLFIRPLSRLDLSTPLGQIIALAVKNNLALYSAHTNLDKARGGVNDILAWRLGLTPARDLAPGTGDQPGLGRLAQLPESCTLESFITRVKKCLGLTWVRAVGPKDLQVATIALCSGSGSSLLPEFFVSGAQVYVTGDMGYHHARSVEDAGLACIDVGHFASEHLMVEAMALLLQEQCTAQGLDVSTEPCSLEQDPFAIY